MHTVYTELEEQIPTAKQIPHTAKVRANKKKTEERKHHSHKVGAQTPVIKARTRETEDSATDDERCCLAAVHDQTAPSLSGSRKWQSRVCGGSFLPSAGSGGAGPGRGLLDELVRRV